MPKLSITNLLPSRSLYHAAQARKMSGSRKESMSLLFYGAFYRNEDGIEVKMKSKCSHGHEREGLGEEGEDSVSPFCSFFSAPKPHTLHSQPDYEDRYKNRRERGKCWD